VTCFFFFFPHASNPPSLELSKNTSSLKGKKNTNTSRIQPLPQLTKITSTFFLCSSPKLAKKHKHPQILAIAEIHEKSLAPLDFDHFSILTKRTFKFGHCQSSQKIISIFRF
jgi:hypothetical protein